MHFDAGRASIIASFPEIHSGNHAVKIVDSSSVASVECLLIERPPSAAIGQYSHNPSASATAS